MDKPPSVTAGPRETGLPPATQQMEPPPPWTLRDTIIGVCVTLIPWIAIATALQAGAPNTQPRVLPFSLDLTSAIVAFLLTAVVEGVFLLAPLWYATLKYRRRISMREGLAALGFRGFRLGVAIGVIVLSIVVIIGADVGYGALISGLHLPIHTNDQVLETEAKYAPLTTYAELAGAIFVAPFCEEIFFRGYVFQGLRQRLNVPLAVVLSALIFGIAHADPGSFPVLFIIGIVLAIVRWRTRSIWPGMGLHMLNNLISALGIIAVMHGAI
jgi:membrane protease YdiL (CAAX protease family)